MSNPFKAKIVEYDMLTGESKNRTRGFESMLAARQWLALGACVVGQTSNDYTVEKFLPEYLCYTSVEGRKWMITLELDRSTDPDYAGGIPVEDVA